MSIHDHTGANGTLVNGRERQLTLVKLPAPEAPPADAPERPVEQPAPAPKPERLYVRAGRKARAIATHERTRTAGRLAVRHGSYVAGGTRIVTKRAWDGRTAARYERMLRACEAAGKMDEAKEWEERGQRFRQDRHRRRMDMLKAPQELAKSVGSGAAVGAGSLLGLGIALAIANEDPSWILAPTMFVFDLLRWAVIIGSVVWGPLMVVGPWLALSAVWAVGRNRQAAPQWALPANQRTDDDPITPSRVVLALRHLGISALRKAILAMEDGGASMLSPIVIAGCGVEVEVLLPLEVSTKEIEARRRKLAENLGRHEHEVFITVAPAARTVRLWIADSGALDEPIGPSPLVTDMDMKADYKSGRAPWGQDLRGDLAAISLYQQMLLITGLSNQGKTASLRALALWLAHDASVEFWIGDLKGIGDWRMWIGLATRLIEGPTDDHVIAVTEMLEDAVAEMERRIMAPAGTKWKPLAVIVDEAQMAFMCPAKTQWVTDEGKVKEGAPYGGSKSTSRYFMAARKIHNQGRVVDVLLWQGTQNPTDQNLPVLVREGAHIRSSLVVGTESQSKMALGDKAVDGGAAPHLLRQGLDKGTLVAAGDGVELPPGQASITIRTHYISTDEAAEIAERVKSRRSRAATRTQAAAAAQRDHLADLATVVGAEERVRTMEVTHRLKNLCAATYTDWDGGRLRKVLTDAGEDTGTYNGYPVVNLDRVLRALANRDQDDDGA
jgi:S-DNA-T family DNA segregation ATPase FtsK/SpoIIIE